jgi:hypothetical protein
MKWKNRKTIHYGAIRHFRTLARTKELQEKFSLRVMESRSSQIQTHHSHLGCKQHHGHQNSNHSLSQSTMGIDEGPD